jgi:cell division protein ZapE
MNEYRARVAAGALEPDPAQRLAVEKLQLLHMRLADYDPARPKRVGLGLFGWGRERLEVKPVPGLYLYGGVGRGKSMLMDLFFGTAPVEPRRRVHFHAFMQEMHAGIARARAAGTTDPVRPVADGVANAATLLCFDEMQISDITDAMLVGRLFERLFDRGVVVVTTSNRAPDELYKNGLNRQLFLPFIALIKARLEVHELASAVDHRLDRLAGAPVYHAPLGPAATAALDAAWERLARGPGAPLALRVQGREVVLPEFRNGVGRASFEALCGGPLGPADYLAIADALDVLVLDDVPVLSRARNNEAKRFVTLIDALYEARVRLIASAAAEPDALYPEGEGAFEFARTASRLHEMRSADWSAPRRGAGGPPDSPSATWGQGSDAGRIDRRPSPLPTTS